MNIKLKDKEINLDGLNEEQQGKLLEFLDTLQVEDDPFDIRIGDKYWSVDELGAVIPCTFGDTSIDDIFVNRGNACKDKELSTLLDDYSTLNRLMWIYSIRHGGRKLLNKGGWDKTDLKYICCFDFCGKEWAVCNRSYSKSIDPYFVDRKTAENCIKEVIEPFMAEHPEIAQLFS